MERIVVASDLHGHEAHALRVVDYARRIGAFITWGGDGVPGVPGGKAVLDIEQETVASGQAVAIEGNNERTLRVVLYRKEHARLRSEWLSDRGTTLLMDYGIDTDSLNLEDQAEVEGAIAQLYSAMQKHDHISFLNSLEPYAHFPNVEYDDQTKGLIVIHAGLIPNLDWETQRQVLDNQAHCLEYSEMPKQYDSGPYAIPAAANPSDHFLVTGHRHMELSAVDRINTSTKHAFIASHLSPDSPIYVYDSGLKQVVGLNKVF